ncbi:OmpA family protein [Myxococcota bacterium]|nr:OmpA family protein [Myxococcota bacterium]
MSKASFLPLAFAAGVLSLVAAPAARAQESTTPGSSGSVLQAEYQRFHPNADTYGYLAAESAATLDLFTPAFGLYLNYANRPLVLYDTAEDGTRFEYGSLVEHHLAADLQAGLGFRYVDVAVALPVNLVLQSGDDTGGFTSVAGFGGIGDFKVTVKGRLVDPLRKRFGLALVLPFTFPTGGEDGYQGNLGVTVAPALVAEVMWGRLRAALNVGYHFRPRASLDAGTSTAVLSDDEMNLRVGAAVRMVRQMELLGEFSAALATVGESDANRNALEWSFGARIRPTPRLALTVAAGTGVSQGFGSPAFRGVVGLTYGPDPASDRDGDGIQDSEDRCPDEPEDIDRFQDEDGCPEYDNDNDGIRDAVDRCPNDPETFNGFEDEDGCPDVGDRDRDGILDSVDACPDGAEDFDGFEDEDGCPDLDNDHDGILDKDDRCPNEKETINGVDDEDGCPDEAKAEVRTNAEGEAEEIVIHEEIFFDFDKAVIKAVSFPVLDAVVLILSKYPGISALEVQGHTDERGSDEYNLRLSQARAEAVRAYLVRSGIDASRLEARGYGESQPKVDGHDESAWAANRRVQFMVRRIDRPTPAVTP